MGGLSAVSQVNGLSYRIGDVGLELFLQRVKGFAHLSRAPVILS